MSHINALTGKKASTYGYCSQITSLPFTDDQFGGIKEVIVQSGAVFIPAIMPTKRGLASICARDEMLCGQGAVSTNEADARDDTIVTQRIIAADEFITAWQKVHAAVAQNPKILIFWCPNIDSNENIQPWWPGSEYVDMVGVDNYPPSGTSFAKACGEFYDGFAARFNKNFCIGETGSFNGGSVEDKEAWVSELANVDLDEFPCYKSVPWFEYLKASDDRSSPEYDYRIVQAQSKATISQTLSNFK